MELFRKIRRDTAANWTAKNPRLKNGERGLESDTRKTKMGDGVLFWNSLPYELSSAALAQPASQIVFGTGAAVSSDAKFTYDEATDSLSLTDVNAASLISITPGITVLSAFNGWDAGLVDYHTHTDIYFLPGADDSAPTRMILQAAHLGDDDVTAEDTSIRITAHDPADVPNIEHWVNGNAKVRITDTFLSAFPHGASAGETYEFRFLELAANGTEYFGIKAADSITTTRILVLPNDAPSAGDFLKVTSFSGGIITTEWDTAAGGGGGMSNPMTTLGDIIYEDSGPSPAALAGNITTTRKFLRQTGNGTISAAPVWDTIVAGDIPTLNQSTTGSAATLSAVLSPSLGGTGVANVRTLTITGVNNISISGGVGATLGIGSAGATVSGTNTGDQTTVSGNAGTATALATGRTISITGEVVYTSPAFDGTGNITAAGTISNAAVIGKVLTGLNILGSTIVATDTILEAFGKIQNQVNGILGGAIYISTWAASTNTPTLADGVGTKGNYYVASNSGSVNFGSGAIDFNTGDWAIYNGTIWQKVDNTDAVSSVNGFIGAVSITTISGNAGTATALQNTRTIGGVSFDGTANITVATATGGFTVSGGNLALGTNSITMSGSIGVTGTRVTKGWFTDLEVTNAIVGSITGSAATLTTPRTIGGVSFNGSANITVLTATGGFTVTGGELVLAAGTTTTASINYVAGTLETTPEAGDGEFDGVNFYKTIDTTSSRGAIPVEQYFKLTSAGGNISTIANFFGATSNISLVANAYYVIDIYCWFTNTTGGTVVWTFTNSAAPTSQNILYEATPTTGLAAPPGSAAYLTGNIYNDASATLALAATGTLSTGVNHYTHFKIFLRNGNGTSLKIQATKGVGGTITPLIGSYWFCRRVSPNNVGTFAA